MKPRVSVTNVGFAIPRRTGQMNVRGFWPKITRIASRLGKKIMSVTVIRAGRDHKLSTFSRRKQCTEKENGIQCSQYHGNTSQYHGNILLDSGAQTSVICIEPAENLPLEGKRVFIKLTRGGGEEEEMTTKAYKV